MTPWHDLRLPALAISKVKQSKWPNNESPLLYSCCLRKSKNQNQFERPANLCSIVVLGLQVQTELNCQRDSGQLTHIVALQWLRWLLVQLTEPVHQCGQLAAPCVGSLAVQHTRLELEAHIQCPLHGVAQHSRSSILFRYFLHFLNSSTWLNSSRTTRCSNWTGLSVWLCLLSQAVAAGFDKVPPRVYRKFSFKSANCQIAHNARRCPERLPCQSKLALGIFFRQLFNYSRPQKQIETGRKCVKGRKGRRRELENWAKKESQISHKHKKSPANFCCHYSFAGLCKRGVHCKI